jgi:hypothetical protein
MRIPGIALLLCVIAADAQAVDDHQPQPKKPAPERSQAIPAEENDGVPTTSDGEPRVVSREGAEYLERLRKGTPFGTVDFNLKTLRAGMGARHEPRVKGVRLIRLRIWRLRPNDLSSATWMSFWRQSARRDAQRSTSN